MDEGVRLCGLEPKSLIVEAVAASSVDYPDQGPGNTLPLDQTFWSSTGSASQESNEWIFFRLLHPVCVLTELRVQVLRAFFHPGYPTYPPHRVQMSVLGGPVVRRSTPCFHVQSHDAMQSFSIPETVVVGGYVYVHFLGKEQRQRTDNMYYHAIRHVGLMGYPVGDQALLSATRLLRSLPLSPLAGRGIPAHLFLSNDLL